MIGKRPGPDPDNGESTSVIGEGSVFEGKMEITGNLRVDGTFKGELKLSGQLGVGRKGVVEADVDTRYSNIAGTIRGNLNSSEKITLQSGSRLEGEMVTSNLVIEEGVSFQGSCNTANETAPVSKKSSKKSEDKQIEEEVTEVAEEIANK